MIRKIKLLTVDSGTEQICCRISQTNCNCECPDCAGTCVDCADCPNLSIADISLWVFRSGDVNCNVTPPLPNYLLMYGAYTFDPTVDLACFLIDMQLLALPAGRYEGEVRVGAQKAGLINFQLGVPYTVCDPFTTGPSSSGNDMQPS